MKFRLIYEGQIRPRRAAGLDDIHYIRRQLHSQMKRLWEFEPLSSQNDWLRVAPPGGGDYGVFEEIDGRVFAPLVSKRVDLVAELDIVFLRQQAPGQLIADGGDIDNRLKTLFDALRVPSKAELQSTTTSEGSDEFPMFCLLQDDSLITRINVETDRLLRPAPNPHDMVAVMQVTVRATRVTFGTIGILG